MSSKAPKKKCCTSTPKCNRCPLRMMAAGTLPAGYTVRKRKLVKLGPIDTIGVAEKKSSKKTKKSGKKGKRARMPAAA